MVGTDICAEVLGVLGGGVMDSRMNKTMICLIPKVEASTLMSQFRPISLCSVIYKLVRKTIATRLKQLMPLIVGPSQSSFVAGRQITDNIIIAQEAIHSMRRKTGKIGVMAMKVDLEKAYDRISWAYLFDTLNAAKLPNTLVDVIMTCVSTSSMQVLWNGSLTETFQPSRGIRQGCPLSPYLFVLCMERLGHRIESAVKRNEWTLFRICKNGPLLTHLFFADHLLLFGQANISTAEALSNTLEEFCASSGMKVSIAKTTCLFSSNIHREDRKQIKDVLGVRVVDSLGRYLGVPLLHQ